MTARTLSELIKDVPQLFDPVAECHWSEENEGWLMVICDPNGQYKSQIFVRGNSRHYKVFKTADCAINKMHSLGVYKINFNLPA